MAIYDCITVAIWFVTIANQSINMVNCSHCIITRFNKLIFANCRGLGLKAIPNNLTKNLQVLDMSENPISEMRADCLTTYQSLLNFTLTFENVKIISIDAMAFAELSDLRYIKLVNINLSTNALLNFPSTLIKLAMINCEIGDGQINVTNLSKLRILNVAYNYLLKVPEIHPNAPIVVINLYETPLLLINYTHMARYCSLRAMIFTVPDDWAMYEYSCQCLSLSNWLAICEIDRFNNFQPSKCNVTKDGRFCADEEKHLIIENRFQCEQNVNKNNTDDEYYVYSYEDEPEPSYNFPIILIIIGIFFLVAVVITFVVLYKKQNRSKRIRTTSLSEFDQYNQGEEEFEQTHI